MSSSFGTDRSSRTTRLARNIAEADRKGQVFESSTLVNSQAKAKIQSIGDTALGFAGAYYEDHIQPVASSYVEWASNVRMSLRERMQKTIDNYRPFDK
ncbi:unnamed protein product [Menidia menidia]|uniref:(Atlantic silverside) hypothetical protein n=1 Tax=Menidia menidia TaxID=238744 RepID=A0A8S4BUV3_9TELE|nr:unnamed protein product [Menidia menidia]